MRGNDGNKTGDDRQARGRLFSLEGKLAAVLVAAVIAGVSLGAVLATVLGSLAAAVAIAAIIVIPLALLAARLSATPFARTLRALGDLMDNYRGGDFSVSVALTRNDELGHLVRAHNALGQALREQRRGLTERELLLDTVVQNTPLALVLLDARDRVVLANLAARQLFNDGRALGGQDFQAVLERCPAALREAAAAGTDALLDLELDGADEHFHLSQRRFHLHGLPHRLLLLRRLTRELSRQEVAIWKKVIRVISHELNNSLAPVSSMADTGADLARRGDTARLPAVFVSIGERARHLHDFIAGYAGFAKLPAPRIESVPWRRLLDELALHQPFHLVGAVPDEAGRFDAAQIEQVLINLLRNAHESGSPAEAVELVIGRHGAGWRIEVRDRGPGMSEQVLAHALLPFYSTKRSGTGLGLALAREIVEAHGGRLALRNREGGGLSVTMTLPGRGASD